MRHTFTSEQWLPYPVEQVFAFFANPENLPRLMPPWQKARIEEASFAPPPPRPASATLVRMPVAAGAGTRMTLSFRPFPFAPFRIAWDAEITEFVWNDHFCDTQHRGPFKYWLHCHRLQRETRTIDGRLTPGTFLRDQVVYELPFGPISEIARSLVIERQFRNLFNFRHKRTADLLPRMFPPANPATHRVS